MARPVMLGNGSLTVGLNEHGLVHDFYYPYVGLENLTTARSVHHKIGIWVDGVFSWVDDGSWDIRVTFDDDALISTIRMRHAELAIELLFNDFVDPYVNAFCRRICVTNQSDTIREIRLFTHQVFEISRAGRADTALFVPEENYILDYKGRCALLIYGQNKEGQVYDQFAIGNYGIEGKEGTFRDAEDGELSGSTVEHGGVDSVMRFTTRISGQQSVLFDYWIVAADSQFSAEKIHKQLKREGLDSRMDGLRRYWHEWLGIAANTLHTVPREYLPTVKRSLMVIKVHSDKRGGVIASADSSIYNYGRDYYSYVWPRDGAYAIWPLIRLGYTDEPQKFFSFCRDILTEDGYLMHKYQPDRAIGSSWHPILHGRHAELPIQEDETATVLFMLGEYLDYTKDEDFVRGLYNTFVQPAANFLARFVDPQTNLPHASYDLWEERFLTHTYTAAVTYQALLVAARLAELFEYPDDAVHWTDVAQTMLAHNGVFLDPVRGSYRKGYLLLDDGTLQFDNTLDVSTMYAVMIYHYYTSPDVLRQTVENIESTLLDKTPSGGTPRYEHDHYFESKPAFLGNPWIITTLWMAQYYVRTGKHDAAKRHLDWALAHALPSGMLPEQINPSTGDPLSVTPLVWSHAELINTILDIAQVD